MFDSVNHTCFPKENHLPDWTRRDNKVTKGDRVENNVVLTVMFKMQPRYATLKWQLYD